jgi:hypothetical protein
MRPTIRVCSSALAQRVCPKCAATAGETTANLLEFRLPSAFFGVVFRFKGDPPMMTRAPRPQPIEHTTPDLPKAVAWAALKAAYTPQQLGLMQVHEHLTERQLNDALRSQYVPPKGLSLA